MFRSLPFLQAWQRAFCTDDCSSRLHILTVWDGVALIGAAPFYLTVLDAQARAEEEAQAAHWQRVQARAEGGDSAPAARTARSGEAPPAAPPDAAPRVGERVVRFAGGVAVADDPDVLARPGGADGGGVGGGAGLLGRTIKPNGTCWICTRWRRRARAWRRPPAQPAAGRCHAASKRPAPTSTCRAIGTAIWPNWARRTAHEIRRKLRRVEERDGSISWTIAADGPELAVAFEEFLELHRLSGAAKAEFMTPAMEAFFPRPTPGVREDRPPGDRRRSP